MNVRNVRMYILQLMIFGVLCVGCTKKGFLPPAVGEQIPYDSVVVDLEKALADMPHTLFYMAWKKSHMDSLLKAERSSLSQLTILVPDNAAFIGAGWSESALKVAKRVDIDTLLMRFVFDKRMTGDFHVGAIPNQFLKSLLPYSRLIENITDQSYRREEVNGVSNNYYTYESGRVPYFNATLSMDEGLLYVNGVESGDAQVIHTNRAVVVPLSKWVEVPTKTVKEAISSDDRYSMYVQLLNYTDSKYRAIFKEANGYDPLYGTPSPYLFYRDSWVAHQMTYDNMRQDRKIDNDSYNFYVGFPKHIPRTWRTNTFFIPTNEAFRQAGFNSLQDLIAFNERRGLPKADQWTLPDANEDGFYAVRGEFATDSLLDYHHNWGLRFGDQLGNGDIDFSVANRSYSLFFGKDLKSHLLNDYLLYQGSVGIYNSNGAFSHRENRSYIQPFLFSNVSPTDIQISIRGGNGSPVRIVEKDLLTLNGVVHGVDRLFIPAGFLTN